MLETQITDCFEDVKSQAEKLGAVTPQLSDAKPAADVFRGASNLLQLAQAMPDTAHTLSFA
jgi:hypothetical protein